MMMSWVMVQVNQKYDPFMVIRARKFQESNILHGFE